jgi:hypothetical protein
MDTKIARAFCHLWTTARALAVKSVVIPSRVAGGRGADQAQAEIFSPTRKTPRYRAQSPTAFWFLLESAIKSQRRTEVAADRAEGSLDLRGKAFHRGYCSESDDCYNESVLDEILSIFASEESPDFEVQVEKHLGYHVESPK